MPRITKCSFCGENIRPGTGLDYIRNDATVYHFCSNKCRVNMMKLKRKPRKFKWTTKYEPKT
ncbi:MAG: 50S ribosomal protein L24e [Candidatus Ranarchaeia archaeon]